MQVRPFEVKRLLVFVLTTAIAGLGCRQPPLVKDEGEANVAAAVTDAGGDFVPSQKEIPPFEVDAGTAAPGFHLQLSEAHFALGNPSSWTDIVRVDDDGSLFAKVRSGCVKGNVGKAGVAKIVDAVDANAYFDPPNAFRGPTDSGSTHLRVRSDGREKSISFTGSLLEPISPGTIIGTFRRLSDGGTETDRTQRPVDTTVPDLPRRKQLAAVLDVVHAVTALGARPVTKCPDDVYSRFDDP